MQKCKLFIALGYFSSIGRADWLESCVLSATWLDLSVELSTPPPPPPLPPFLSSRLHEMRAPATSASSPARPPVQLQANAEHLYRVAEFAAQLQVRPAGASSLFRPRS